MLFFDIIRVFSFDASILVTLRTLRYFSVMGRMVLIVKSFVAIII